MAEKKSAANNRPRSAFEALTSGYKGGEEMPLSGYLTLLSVYNAAFAAMLLATKSSGHEFPKKVRAAALGFGFLFAPRVTRFVSGVFAAVTISDFLQHAYEAAKEKK